MSDSASPLLIYPLFKLALLQRRKELDESLTDDVFSTSPLDFRLLFVYDRSMFDPDAHMPRINRGMVYLGACLIAGIRLAREKQVNMRVIPTRTAVDESIDMAKEIYSQVFRKVPEQMKDIH